MLILVNPKSTNEIASAIQTIYENSNLRNNLIIKGLERVKDFSWEKTAQKHLQIFENVNMNRKL